MEIRVLCALFGLVAMCGVGCSAFDSGTPTVNDPTNPIVSPEGSENVQQGFYTGTMTLESNSCATIATEIGAEEEFAVDVLQAEDLVSLQFDDGTQQSATLDGNSATVVRATDGMTRIYAITFNDDQSITGSCDVAENDADGKI